MAQCGAGRRSAAPRHCSCQMSGEGAMFVGTGTFVTDSPTSSRSDSKYSHPAMLLDDGNDPRQPLLNRHQHHRAQARQLSAHNNSGNNAPSSCKSSDSCLFHVVVTSEQARNHVNLAHLFAKVGDLRSIRTLQDQSPALFDEVTVYGWTPLHYAAWEGHLDVCEYLCDTHSSMVPEVDRWGWTALHCAAQQNHVDVCRYLVEAQGMSELTQNESGQAAVDLISSEFARKLGWSLNNSRRDSSADTKSLLTSQ